MADTLTFSASRPGRSEPAPGSFELVGDSPIVRRLRELVRRSALLDGGVLVVAERGTDAESVAREMHARGRPDASPFVAIECGADGALNVERALFGPPITSASTDLESASRDSHVAAARGGTLFLHDVVELPAALQARLARLARDGEMRVDGGVTPTEFRVIASAQPSIDGDVRENRFRADLYRRLSASRIDMPALRDRLEDIPAIAACVLAGLAAAGQAARTFAPASLALLSAVPWPGNLEELRGVIERIVRGTPGQIIQVEDVLPALHLERATCSFVPTGSLRDARLRFERDYIAAVLQHHGWRMAEAAQALGIQRPNLYRKARQLGIPLTRVTE
jgi:DNA-binding NtrC family response regulator